MPGHVAWKGHLRLSLIAVPVRAYTASRSGQAPISLNQLHAECHNRIRYRKTCPVHGEVPNNEIVMGYEYAKDEYVVIDPEELDRLRTEAERSINVAAFVQEGSVDPNYFSGRTYYLLPDGPVGERPYALLRQAMADKDVCGLAQVVITSREHLVLVRAMDRLLVMNLLEYAAQVKPPAEFESEAPKEPTNKEELKLTKLLVDALQQSKPHLEQFRDEYYDKLQDLIDAKIDGREIVAPPDTAPVRAINFMDALKASVKEVKAPRRSTKTSPAKRASSSHLKALRAVKKSAAAKKRRKSG